MFSLTVLLSIRRIMACKTAVVLTASVTLVLSGCSSPGSCPAFSDPEPKTWFPYRTGHEYFFKGSNGVTDSLMFTTIDRSTPYTSGNHYEYFTSSEGTPLTSGNNSNGLRISINSKTAAFYALER